MERKSLPKLRRKELEKVEKLEKNFRKEENGEGKMGIL